MFICGVNDTGEKFIGGVVDTGEMVFGGVTDTGNNLGILPIFDRHHCNRGEMLLPVSTIPATNYCDDREVSGRRGRMLPP
jgi:hypothetical protein